MTSRELRPARRHVASAYARAPWPGVAYREPPPVTFLPSGSNGIVALEADDARRVLIVYPANGTMPTVIPFEHVYAMYELEP